jgi:hypothetical protein
MVRTMIGKMPPLMERLCDHGKRHGRYLISNGMISTTTLLSEMRSSTNDSLNGSGPSKRLRLDTGSTSIEQLQSEMQEMRESWEQELQLEREAREHELAAGGVHSKAEGT